MIYDEATRSDSHFNHLSVFLLPNEMGGSQTRQYRSRLHMLLLMSLSLVVVVINTFAGVSFLNASIGLRLLLLLVDVTFVVVDTIAF